MKKLFLLFLLFNALNPIFGQTLTRIDSIAGKSGVVDRLLGSLDSTLFYVANSTTPNYFAIKAIKPGSVPQVLIDSIDATNFDSRHNYNFMTQGGQAFFVVYNASFFYDNILYSSNGTKSGTKKLVQSSEINFLQPFKNNIVFYNDSKVSIYNITSESIQDVYGVYFYKGISGLVVMNNIIYAVGRTDKTGTYLLESKGVSGDMKKLKLLASGDNYTEPYDVYMNVSNNRIYFFNYNSADKNIFWTSDGTAAGTKSLKEFDQNWTIITNNYGVTIDNKYYFIANGYDEGYEVWETDGSSAGTKAYDYSTGSDSSFPNSIISYKNKPYFNTYDDILYVENLTVKVSNSGDFTGGELLSIYNDSLLYRYKIINVGQELVLSGGNSYKKLTNGNDNNPNSFTMGNPMVIGKRIYLSAQKGTNTGYELWVYEGKKTVVIAPLAATITQTGTIKCNGEKITLKATATGGTLPFKYLWNNGATTESLTSIGAGVHSVTVTSNDKQSIIASVTLTEPTKMVVTTTTKAANPQFKNGNAVAAAAGGTPPYTYAWNTNPIQTTATAIGLIPGNYMVSVTDGNGCKTTVTTTVGTSTSTDSAWEKYSFAAFPNPATDILTISFNGLAVQKVDVLLIDATGKIVLTQTFDNNRFSLNVAELPQGIYTLKCTIGQEEANSTILIQR